MKKLAILTGIGFLAVGGIGTAVAQPYPASGTPGSPFPHAAPHEIRIINGVPCRTVMEQNTGVRRVVECAEPGVTGSVNMAPAQPMGVPVAPQSGAASGTPGSPFPYAAPHEIRIINGVPCRTVMEQNTGVRRVVECAQ